MPAFALGIQKMIFISKKVQSCVCFVGMFHQQYINYVIHRELCYSNEIARIISDRNANVYKKIFIKLYN